MALVETRQQLVYAIDQPVPLWQVAESLLALEAIIRRTPPVLEQVFPGATISHVEVFLSSIQSGSLLEEFLVKFVFGSQQELDDFIAGARRKLGMDALSDRGKILSAVVMAFILFGGGYAMRYFTPDDSARLQIEANNNVIIGIGADAADLTPGELRRIIEAAITDRRQLANDSIKVLRPAKAGDGSIRMGEDPNLEISQETVRAVPSQVFPEEPSEYLQDFDSAEIEVRATDLDSLKRGWGVRVIGLSDRRIPMQIDGGIDPRMLASGARLRGHITVVFERQGTSEPVPRKVYLRSLVSPDADARTPPVVSPPPR